MSMQTLKNLACFRRNKGIPVFIFLAAEDDCKSTFDIGIFNDPGCIHHLVVSKVNELDLPIGASCSSS